MKSKIKRTLVLDARMINVSGIGRYIQALIPSLIEASLKLVLLGKRIDLIQFQWFNEIGVVEVDCPIYSIKEQFQILFRTPRCDIFIAPHYNVPVFLPQAKSIAVIIPDINHLAFAKELSLFKVLYAKIFYKLASRKDYVFTISDFSKLEIVKYTKCNPDKIIVAKCAIDKIYFKQLADKLAIESIPLEISQLINKKYILYIGNLKPHKNLKRALAAFENVLKEYVDLEFLIVGKKNNFLTGDEGIFKLVQDNSKLNQKVHFTGHISDLGLAYLYKNAMLFLFPSLYEGFGLPPLESMFFGCPVIVSKEGSLPEICGDSALYCDAYDENDIAKVIADLLSNNTLRSELKDKGYKKVDEFSWDKFNQVIISGLKLE